MLIDHIGYAVKNIDKARESFEVLGFEFEEKIEDPDRNILIQFGKNNGYRIELVAPLDSNTSPVDSIISKIGATPYHICYRSKNIEQSIKELESKKYKVIIPLTEAIAFGRKRVVFLMNRFLGMIEIVEE